MKNLLLWILMKNPWKFYRNFKIHKPHTPMRTLLPRPIISGSGSITENIATYLENPINTIATQHTSYLQEPPHFYELFTK